MLATAAVPSLASPKKKTNKLHQGKITKENLYNQIKEATKELLEMAKERSWNKISNDVSYVIKKGKSERMNLDSAIKQLKSEFENIYLIELYVFKAEKKETIVEIKILEKSELDFEYRKTAINESPTLHCKVAIPPYIGLEEKGKFDINWQWETFEYKWKMFLWRRKIKTG